MTHWAPGWIDNASLAAGVPLTMGLLVASGVAMTEFRRQQRCQAMRWLTPCNEHTEDLAERADEIVTWINDNDGQARYCNAGTSERPDEPCIAVRTPSGYECLYPGWYVMLGDRDFGIGGGEVVHEFIVKDPETFEREGWVRAEGGRGRCHWVDGRCTTCGDIEWP